MRAGTWVGGGAEGVVSSCDGQRGVLSVPGVRAGALASQDMGALPYEPSYSLPYSGKGPVCRETGSLQRHTARARPNAAACQVPACRPVPVLSSHGSHTPGFTQSISRLAHARVCPKTPGLTIRRRRCRRQGRGTFFFNLVHPFPHSRAHHEKTQVAAARPGGHVHRATAGLPHETDPFAGGLPAGGRVLIPRPLLRCLLCLLCDLFTAPLALLGTKTQAAGPSSSSGSGPGAGCCCRDVAPKCACTGGAAATCGKAGDLVGGSPRALDSRSAASAPTAAPRHTCSKAQAARPARCWLPDAGSLSNAGIGSSSPSRPWICSSASRPSDDSSPCSASPSASTPPAGGPGAAALGAASSHDAVASAHAGPRKVSDALSSPQTHPRQPRSSPAQGCLPSLRAWAATRTPVPLC